ncbi:MAG: tRNA pseudouridine(55) synthase TruB [Tepidisphaeraceae bacterium]|jgi:tRNA pseudouridine55 synthase
MAPSSGIINLDKPPAMSSAAAVNRVKRLLPRGTRIGHAGTLDPFATGVLLLLVGTATKSSQALMNEPKTYEATVKLGATTPTDDPESDERPTANPPAPTIEQIHSAVAGLVGQLRQVPPAYSAKKLAGRRAYKLARRGAQVNLEPQTVRIDAIEILAWQWPLLRLRIDCGRGTYIRAIARDLGQILQTGGYLVELRRTRIGPFSVDGSITLQQILRDGITASTIHKAIPNK